MQFTGGGFPPQIPDDAGWWPYLEGYLCELNDTGSVPGVYRSVKVGHNTGVDRLASLADGNFDENASHHPAFRAIACGVWVVL